MIYLLLAMLVSLIVAGLVVVYVAYPARGEKVPRAPWLGDLLERTVAKAPTIDEEERDLLRHG